MNLVDDVDLVLPDLRWNPHLFHQTADVIHRVVGSSVQLVNVERGVVVEGTARLAFVAGLKVLGGVEAVDGLGHDTGTGGLAHATRTAKQEGLCQSVVADGILQGVGDGALTHDGVEGHRPVFSCGYDKIFHIGKLWFQTDKGTTFRCYFREVATFIRFFAFCIENRPIFVPMKMLVLVPKVTGRVMYVFDLVLEQLLGIEYDLTTDFEQFNTFEGSKLHYGMQRLGDEPFVKAVDILFERHIHEQSFRTVEFEGTMAPYAVYGQGNLLPFDVFAASFFLVSRYEEYLSQVRDQYGRFRAESTWMFENGMMQKPLVNIWALALGNKLKAIYPNLKLKQLKFTFVPTYDVDAAWAYKCKGLYRTLGGFVKDLTSGDRERIRERHQVLRGKRKDPFDSFDFQFELQKEFKLKPIYFILCGDYDTNDKNISIRKPAFQALIKRLGDYADVGIHPSFSSYLDVDKLRMEIDSLSEVLHRPLTKSRQHFLRMNLPRSYQKLIELDISDDYTMGFASQAGFRAGIADTFRFYDLENDMVTNLRVHPFALMDGTMRDYLNLDVEASFALATQLVDGVKAVGGTFIYLTHNETLGGEKRWVGWPEMYRQLLEYITKAPEP